MLGPGLSHILIASGPVVGVLALMIPLFAGGLSVILGLEICCSSQGDWRRLVPGVLLIALPIALGAVIFFFS